MFGFPSLSITSAGKRVMLNALHDKKKKIQFLIVELYIWRTLKCNTSSVVFIKNLLQVSGKVLSRFIDGCSEWVTPG